MMHRKSLQQQIHFPAVIWLTGLSGSGKTTIGRIVFEKLRANNIETEIFDGDEIRHVFPQTGFTRLEREQHIQRIAFAASRLEAHGVTTIVALISPYLSSREFARNICNNFIEVFVSTPLEICEKRDVKGLYAKARKGQIKNFTGISDPYEPPPLPEVELDTTHSNPQDAARYLLLHSLPPTNYQRPVLPQKNGLLETQQGKDDPLFQKFPEISDINQELAK